MIDWEQSGKCPGRLLLDAEWNHRPGHGRNPQLLPPVAKSRQREDDVR